MRVFTTEIFAGLGVCAAGLNRVSAFGGQIINSPSGWQLYIDAHPDSWDAPLFTAWQWHRRGDIQCPDLIWRVARIAFREQPEKNASLRVYGETLGPDNWQDVCSTAYDISVTAIGGADSGAAYHAAVAATRANTANTSTATFATRNLAMSVFSAATYAANGAIAAARSRVKAGIFALAVEAMAVLNERSSE